MAPWGVLYIGGPFFLGFLTAALTRMRWPTNGPWLLLAGVLFAFAWIVAVYLGSPHDYAHSQGDNDGEMFLGRWWEPAFTVLLAIVGYVIFLVGVGVGMGVAVWFDLEGRALRKQAAP